VSRRERGTEPDSEGGSPDDGDAPVLELDGVTVRYGDRTVLDDVSLRVRRGEFLALVGPNGAGKTTLLRTVNGLVTPDAGAVRVAGTDTGALSVRRLARRVATVPQETSVGFDFPVRDLVAMGRTAHRSRFSRTAESDRAAVRRALDRTDTAAFADRAVGSLSGGERQRVVLARALAQSAPLLLLDEPTASLDINHQVRVLGLVRDLVGAATRDPAGGNGADSGRGRTGAGEEGSGETSADPEHGRRTAVAAIHDLDLAARFCDRVALLADGQVQAVGPPHEVLDEDRLAAAYGVATAVRENAVTGTPTVTALGERAERRAGRPTTVVEADDD
jgi:iron complex transport system ATP-binding protein